MSDDIGVPWAVIEMAIVVLAAVTSAALIIVLRPWLRRYALARPNARSSHSEPTPQGGGIAVIAATILAAWVALHNFAVGGLNAAQFAAVFGAAVLIACVGAVDDIRPLAVMPRLLLQAIAVGIVILALPGQLRIFPSWPLWVERVLLLMGGVWFVNLVNFMDGIDWMTVAEVVPLTGALVVIGTLGALPLYGVVAALALGGAVLGFGYFNRPVAKLFLGDVGSLSIGLIIGWLLVLVAGGGHLVAAFLLPLYYLADTTITLAQRLARRETIWKAHRTHFYQRAIRHGHTVLEVVGRVFVVNVGLCALAVMTVIVPGKTSDVAALLVGIGLVGALLVSFARADKITAQQ